LVNNVDDTPGGDHDDLAAITPPATIHPISAMDGSIPKVNVPRLGSVKLHDATIRSASVQIKHAILGRARPRIRSHPEQQPVMLRWVRICDRMACIDPNARWRGIGVKHADDYGRSEGVLAIDRHIAVNPNCVRTHTPVVIGIRLQRDLAR
jgi:hypothetical protein